MKVHTFRPHECTTGIMWPITTDDSAVRCVCLLSGCTKQKPLNGSSRVVHGLGWPMGWVDLGRNFSVFGGLGWVGSTTAKELKIWKDYVNAWIYGGTSWGLRACFLSCCWGHFKHFFKQLVFEWHNDTVFNMCNDSKEHEEVCLVDCTR